ncbi:hypothetical protein J4416_00525 [Candidatus Pacearchaeota archaeon]|nr:hypothetical protein [Candidatus Pacearchaeota archaeon]
MDLVAVTDISTALSTSLAGGSSGSATASDDAYPLFTGSTPIQLNNSISSVRTSISETNLPSVLGKEDFSGNVDAQMTFNIVPGTNRVIYQKQPTSSDDPVNAVAMTTSASTYFYNATVSFNRAVNFTHADSKNEEIQLFGQTFLIGSATDTTTLVLFKSAETVFLTVGGTTSTPSATVVVGDETYTIELTAATDTSATIRVTDSAGASDQKEVNEAASKKILGIEVAVNTADESTATNTLSAEVMVGASRIKLQDASEVLYGSDDDSIDGTRVSFNSTAGPGAINKLTIQVFAPDGSNDAFAEGDSFVDPVFGSFRFVYAESELTEDDRETIKVAPSGNDHISFTATNWQNKELTNQEWVNNESGGTLGPFLGDSNEWRIYVQEHATINESAYAMVGNEDEGYLVKLRTLTNSTALTTTDRIIFENVFDTTESWEATISSEGTGTIDIGGKSYGVTYHENASDSGNGAGRVQLNYPDSSAGQTILYPTVETSKGAKMMLYEPLTLNLSSDTGMTGLSTVPTFANLTGILIPDGDGFTTTAIVTTGLSGYLGGNWTFGTSALNTSGNNSINITAGKLTFAVVAADVMGQVTVRLLDPQGARITVPSMVLLEEKDESNNYEAVILQSGGNGISTSSSQITDTDFTWNSDADMSGTAYGSVGFQSEADDDLYYMEDQWGTLVETDQSNSNAYVVTVSYPDEQVTAGIYVDGLVEGTGSTTLGDVKVMDDELASSGMSVKNLIVVGGSCVNTAASSLLGGSAGCGASWTAATNAGTGDWIIQTFANPWASSKVATLVAGWEQGDTANAATYLTKQNPKTDVGSKWTGTTATAATSVGTGTTA